MKKVALKLTLALALLAGMGNVFAAKPPFPTPCFGTSGFCGPEIPGPEPTPCAFGARDGRCIVPMPVLY